MHAVAAFPFPAGMNVGSVVCCRRVCPDAASHRMPLHLKPRLMAAIDTRRRAEKIAALPIDWIAEVEDFVEFVRLRGQDRALARAATAASEAAFAGAWDNPEDAVYDGL